jgi:hypothetical protein
VQQPKLPITTSFINEISFSPHHENCKIGAALVSESAAPIFCPHPPTPPGGWGRHYPKQIVAASGRKLVCGSQILLDSCVHNPFGSLTCRVRVPRGGKSGATAAENHRRRAPSRLSHAVVLADAQCINLKQSQTFSFEGKLTHKVFPGPPNYEDVRKGDKPEPSYILQLPKRTCVSGSDEKIDRVQIFPGCRVDL